MKTGIELLKKLSECFGPAGCEYEVEKAIREELEGLPVTLSTDRMGNLTAHLERPTGAPRVMLSAHMDEVGMMLTDVEEDGLLRFKTVGGIDPSVLSGRFILLGDDTAKRVKGTISAKGIHLQDREERKKMPTVEECYIDIGTSSKEETEKLLSLGDSAVFDTKFSCFGKDNAFIKGKALDDRAGCAVLIEVLREVADKHLPLDLYFCFTVREEIGLSGARVTAQRLSPDAAVILEATAVADLPKVAPAARVSEVGKGGVLSLMDRSTIYDRDFLHRTLSVAEKHGIPVQLKRYVSGGNDAAHIQKSGVGVRCLALSLPTRYLHAPVSVASFADVKAMQALVAALLADWEKEDVTPCTQH